MKAFISYSWDSLEHREWVKELAIRLRHEGIETVLDQWHLALGDQLPQFMEESIRDNDYVLIICTPQYRVKSNERRGGVGYEGDIMSAEVLLNRNLKKFIPVLREGEIVTSIPTWLSGKMYVDLRGETYSEQGFNDLKATLLNIRERPPEVKKNSSNRKINQQLSGDDTEDETKEFTISIEGIIVDKVSVPKMDGTAGSALYSIPFKLNRYPSNRWKDVFINTWNNPPRFTTMHRPGIARVSGDEIILNGSTIEEVKRYHRDTLKLCVEKANRIVEENVRRETEKKRIEQVRLEQHNKSVSDIARDINFD